tara:strand:- start:25 stop:513 length:489 start_codon:yes stop_codon:yes gene_type:complete
MIRFIVTVLRETGEIYDINTPPGAIREDLQEGIISGTDPELEIFHILTGDTTFQELDSSQIKLRYYRKSDAWAFRGDPPSGNHDWNVNTSTWTLNSESFWSQIRRLRNLKLQGSDWTQLRDSDMSIEKRNEWQSYRAQLRSIPTDFPAVTDINNITWPTPPS